MSIELQEVKRLLQGLVMELRCELTGWDKSIPIDSLKHWIKKIDNRIIKRIDNND